MEQNLAGKTNDKVIPSGARDFDKVKPNTNPNASRSSDALPKDPVYQSDRQEGSKVGESYEGFSPSKDIGMQNLEKSDGFGSKFQMPGHDMSEKYMNHPQNDVDASDRPMRSKPLNVPAPVEFVDIQTTLATLQDLVAKIRANLESPEQGELEALMLQGSQLLQTHWKLISTTATSQVSALKEDVKENPYRALIAALKIGMAISQVVSATRAGVHAPVDSGEVDMSRVAL